jgi:hypothetical protein
MTENKLDGCIEFRIEEKLAGCGMVDRPLCAGREVY